MYIYIYIYIHIYIYIYTFVYSCIIYIDLHGGAGLFDRRHALRSIRGLGQPYTIHLTPESVDEQLMEEIDQQLIGTVDMMDEQLIE